LFLASRGERREKKSHEQVATVVRGILSKYRQHDLQCVDCPLSLEVKRNFPIGAVIRGPDVMPLAEISKRVAGLIEVSSWSM